jgi:hypothetical protein
MKRLIAVALLTASAPALAKECTREEAYAAESVTDYLESWRNVHLFYQQFGHCFDGVVAEGLEDKVRILWADHWSTLPEMIELTDKDKGFKQFLWQRISDETFPQDAFARLVQHAKSECPAVATEFCRAVLTTARR